MAGQSLVRAHPNLRKRTDLRFVRHDTIAPADVTFVTVPHTESMDRMPGWLASGGIVVDLSADFRLQDPAVFERYYAVPHAHPELLPQAVYGVPELHREALRRTRLIANPGCIAIASILALRPLVDAKLVGLGHSIVVDAKSGSSASGIDPGPAGVHAERAGAVRAYAPTGHRHTAEIEQETGARIALTAHAVDPVRGVLVTAHAPVARPTDDKELWKVYRQAYSEEPFVRVVRETEGIHRSPEPKVLFGSNYADVGFYSDPHAGRIVALCAIDNLMKGAAGNALQCFNLAAGFPETAGLEFAGLHPI
jgi:N-acetyl-gamma-glutamyl-phosphate/LysW-gamma-L-alpha-aminoadipyl-6-phosphate reductase